MLETSCHFCGDTDQPHMLADCRPDLVEHEIGEKCTWWTSYQLGLEYPDDPKFIHDIKESCYAYQDHFTNEWGDEHKHFYPNESTTGYPWWICDTCGFDAKKFEPREEKQADAMRWHIALHDSGRITING